jgi:hypothetical protein
MSKYKPNSIEQAMIAWIKNQPNLIKEQEAPKKQGADTPEDPVSIRQPKMRDSPAKDSVDDQIDALILRYETSSIRAEPSLNESLKSLNLKFLLEQEEEESLDEPVDDAPIDEPPAEGDTPAEEAPEPEGSEKISVTTPAEDQAIPDLDIDRFANKVVRLLNNYQSLLNVEEAVLNRAKTFLDENYGDAFVKAFNDTLMQNYGIESVEFDNVSDVGEDAYAVGAFAGGTGSLPSGGG